jgi:hypothetical protein
VNRGIALSVAGGTLLTLVITVSTAAHEDRELGEYTLDVGFLNEPAFSGEENGLFLHVSRGDEPILGLEETLEASVSFGSQTRQLDLAPSFSEPGSYVSAFFPTAAGPYTFGITGQIEEQAIDESFTSGPDTFSEVQDATGGQFPVQFPPPGDVARDARSGAAAATTATIALVAGIAGLVVGFVALGLSLSRRQRR